MRFRKTSLTEVIDDPNADPNDETNAEATGEDGSPSKSPRVWAGRRLVALIAGVAVLSLLAGIVVMQFVVSPAELAARTAAPSGGPVTAPIEDRVIENKVTTRGEVTYADSVEVQIDASAGEGRAVVTGQVPKVGAVLEAGHVALEVAGRPVIVLAGELPAYRSLSIGMSGPDVLQLKAALTALDYFAGDTGSNVFEWDTVTAIGQLYEGAGYSAPTGGDEAQTALRSAQAGVRQAEISLAQANASWNTAASQSGDTDLSVANAEIEAAKSGLADAQQALSDAQEAVLPTMPSSEVLFLSSMPRRVDEVRVKRGDIVSGSAMSVSGAELTIVGTLSKQDADLLSEKMEATYTSPGGEELTATVIKVDKPKGKSKDSGGEGQEGSGDQGGGDRYTVSLNPGKLTSEQIEQMRGTNVRVQIPVASTDGKVLAVPLAALSAGADGSNRVELMVGDNNDPFKTETVEVTAGLAADGVVEIKSDDSRIKPGAKVVVGR